MRADDFGMVARHWRGIANDEMSTARRRGRSTNAATSTCTSRCSGWASSRVTSTPTAPRSSSKPWTTAHHPTRPAVRYRRGRWRNDAPTRWSTSAAPTSSGNAEGTAPVNLNVTMDHGTLTGCAAGGSASGALRARRLRPHPAGDRVPPGVRLLGHPGADARRVRSPRPRPLHPPRVSGAAQGVGDPRPRLCVPRLRPAARLVQRASPRLVGTRRPHRRTEPLPAVSPPPHPLPRRRLGPHPQRRRHLPKPTNHPPATSQPDDTDAHHPAPPDLLQAPRTPPLHCPARREPWNGLWRSLVSASVWGTEGPGFKSRQPDYRGAVQSV